MVIVCVAVHGEAAAWLGVLPAGGDHRQSHRPTSHCVECRGAQVHQK